MAPVAVQSPSPVEVLKVEALSLGAPVVKGNYTDEEKAKKIFETSYEPSESWWSSNQLAYTRPADDPLPAGFPEHVSPKTLWDGKQLINQPEKWLYTFTAEDVALLNKAYDHFAALNVHNNEIARATFPIPAESKLYAELQNVTHEINHGVGLRVLRGLPVDEWERNKQIVIFAGISAYLGSETRQRQGVSDNNITHLRDITHLAADDRPAIVVKGQTSGNQVFHNDGAASIVGLITLGVAEEGGLSQLSSAAATYNDLANSRRDILRTLAKPDWVSHYGAKGDKPDEKALLYLTDDGKEIFFAYSRRPFFGFYEAKSNVPPLSEDKHLALDAVHFTAEKYSLDIELQKGDLEYFNNHTVFHARTSSRDSEKNARHLIRIYIENHEQEVPAALQPQFDAVNKRDGPAPDKWPLEAWDKDS
ncbi:hypothetical protein Q8F55_009231 [Vanrija albida]|uniref:TauD/TfdA-like domain-containing protein n=1 Tax=Vanrija albida TaxID=181172 RepID=A0ABR3PTZ1_9TREE